MSKTIKSTAAVCAFVAVAVIFFLTVLCLAIFVPDDPYADLVPDDGMVFERMEVDVVWSDDRSCKITQRIEARFKQSSHGIYVDIPVNSGERIRDLSLTAKTGNGIALPYSLEHESGFSIVRAKVGDADRMISPGNTLVCELSYNYITPVHPDGKDILDINAIGYGWSSDIEHAVVTVTYPAAPQTESGFGVYVGDNTFRNVSVSDDGLTYTVNVGRLNAFENVRVKHKMPEGTLQNYSSTEPVFTILIGVVVIAAAIALMVFIGRDKPLSPVVDFYPPRVDGADGRKRYMLPVQMGKIIDGNCSDGDVTSLIFYWASEGYIEIEEKDGETYFKKLRKIDEVAPYEKTLFDKIFSYATPSDDGSLTVAASALSGKIYGAVEQAKSELNAQYRGKLYKTPYTVLAVGFGVLCALYGVLMAVLCTLRVGTLFNFAGIAVLLPVLVAVGFGTVLMLNYQKLTVARRRLFLALLFISTVLLAAGVMLLVPTHAMSWTEKFVFAACLGGASAITPFLTKRTTFYTEQLNDIIGFRDFLRDAEKDRLEALLKDDPQYYYNILPYANVLGVSDIWADKFKGLALEPPAYYHGGNVTLFDVLVINHLMNSIGRTMSYVPPKASGRSFSGGHFGGGGHGGGFGGFGGGGGGRW